MDVKLLNGDIAKNSCGNAQFVSGVKEIAQRIKIACTIKKGSFVYDNDFGRYYDRINADDEMVLEKLEMIFKEASVDIPYTDLKVISLNTDDKKQVACVEVFCGDYSTTTEVIIDGKL